MDAVTRPAEEKSPIAFYELEEVKRIVAAQSSLERRALFAILYGTGIEVSTALRGVEHSGRSEVLGECLERDASRQPGGASEHLDES